MYDLIDGIINHVWDIEQYDVDAQNMIYAISGTIICIVIVWILDAITHFIINLGKKGGR